VLRRVTEEGAYSTLALSAELERSGLSPQDRPLAADLVYGTLRHSVQLDHAIAAASTRSLKRIDRPALAALRLGAYQILHTRIPPHAAVAETVSLAGARERGFVNAILRKLASTPADAPTGEDDRAVSLRTGMAEWAVAELRRLLPAEDVERAAAAFASPTDISLRVNTCRTSADALRERLLSEGIDPRPGRYRQDVLRVAAIAPGRLPGYQEGWFTVQDESSVLVAAAVDPREGERILDACAGPGGKTTFLACATGEGVVVAGDARFARVNLVRAASERLGTPALLLVQDAVHPALRDGFDAVLVDAPCSGLGAARRRPELLWRPKREDLSRLARLQASILAGAAALVRPGGRVVYSVCTFPRAETEAVVRAFQAKRPDFEPAEIAGPDGPATSHRLWPHVHDTDGMFYAGFRRAE
jgi:16S rRNA (cytosine967-C5)-methyltransferase